MHNVCNRFLSTVSSVARCRVRIADSTEKAAVSDLAKLLDECRGDPPLVSVRVIKCDEASLYLDII